MRLAYVKLPYFPGA